MSYNLNLEHIKKMKLLVLVALLGLTRADANMLDIPPVECVDDTSLDISEEQPEDYPQAYSYYDFGEDEPVEHDFKGYGRALQYYSPYYTYTYRAATTTTTSTKKSYTKSTTPTYTYTPTSYSSYTPRSTDLASL